MCQLGYVEGRTVVFEARGADGKPDRQLALAAQLARLKVDVIVTGGTPTAEADSRPRWSHEDRTRIS
jgi:putative ABC transport system substrate-binding protein